MTNQSSQILEMTAITAGRSYTLSYFDRPGSGPTILYIHGLGCSKADPGVQTVPVWIEHQK